MCAYYDYFLFSMYRPKWWERGAKKNFGIIVWRIRGYGVEPLIWDVQTGHLTLNCSRITDDRDSRESAMIILFYTKLDSMELVRNYGMISLIRNLANHVLVFSSLCFSTFFNFFVLMIAAEE